MRGPSSHGGGSFLGPLFVICIVVSTYRHQALSIAVCIGLPLGQIIETVCSNAPFPDVCSRELSGFQIPITANPLSIVSYALQAAASRVDEAHGLAAQCAGQLAGQRSVESQCASDCAQLMLDTKDKVDAAMEKLVGAGQQDPASLRSYLRDVKVWLSASLSYQTACSDNFDEAPGSIQQEIDSNQAYLAEVLGNAMSLVDTLSQNGNDWTAPPSPPSTGPHLRRLLASPPPHADVGGLDELDEDGVPAWVSTHNMRKLLQAPPPSSGVVANAVVAQDGSGNFLDITSAVNSIPVGGYSGRYIIYIKAGVYDEVFNVSKDLQDISFLGDGIDVTVITGNRSVASGLFNTYRTSTVGVMGSGFMARDITFRNTAGANGHQAVALRAGGDFAVFYRCSFEGYQDTLYALASRQFYRDCAIYGTVDFIFGNAIAVFQNCQLLAREPLPNQQNTYTAQGRKLAADVSGFSFQNCSVTGDPALLNSSSPAPTYLGRPWKAYSRVAFLQSDIASLVDPAGWLPWNSTNPFTDTLYYGEYQNVGAGSSTSLRVAWPGVHPNMSLADAAQFTVENFIAGQTWLGSFQVTYQDSLA